MAISIYPDKKNNNNSTIKVILVEFLFLCILALPVLVVLGYFHIIPLPFFPKKGILDEKQKIEQKIYNEQPVLFVCPLEPELCTAGRPLFDAKTRIQKGFAYTALNPNTSIYAAMDGTYMVVEEKQSGFKKTTVSITGVKGDFKVTYVFSGDPSPKLGKSGEVKQKDTIGIIKQGKLQLVPFTTQLYALYVTLVDARSGQNFPVAPSKDGKGLRLN